MARRPLARRAFLIGGGVAGAGLVLGYAWLKRYPELRAPANPDQHLFNAWIKIGTDGTVTVFVPQAEMGQGVTTALPLIVTDELGADWTRVAVEPAPIHPVYANPAAVLDGMHGVIPRAIESGTIAAVSLVVRKMAVLATGGSTSVRSFREPLRMAAAAARTMLCMAAAQRWGVDWQACSTGDGKVVHGERRLDFGALADDASKLVPPDPVPLRQASQSWIGSGPPRLDIPAKVDGSAQFGLDIRIDKLVYAAIRQGPVAGARLERLDEKAARAVKGVIAVVRDDRWVAVVAESWWQAQSALDAAAPVFAPPQAQPPSAEQVHQLLNDALAGDGAHVYEEEGDAPEPGSVEAAGLLKHQADYAVPYLAHACLEPMNATVRLGEGRAEVWAPTQSPTAVLWAVARELDLDEQAVAVYPTLVGGGFGRKAEVDAVVQAVRIARKIGRPVQLIWSREEDLTHDVYRPAVAAHLAAGIDARGHVSSFDVRMAGQSVSQGFTARQLPLSAPATPDGTSVQGAIGLPYEFGYRRVAHTAVELPVPVGFWRSVGHSYTAFFVESFIDELAHQAKLDPLALRLGLLRNAPFHRKVLSVAADQAGWGAPLAPGRGRGIALHECFGSIVAQVAEVTVDKEGAVAVDRVVCAVDCGTVIHRDTVVAQIEGGLLFGLTAALHGQISFADGHVDQTNFDAYPLLGLAATPAISVHVVASTRAVGGIGEVATPPIAPAVVNAIFAATGRRIRTLPVGTQLATNPR